jgi:trans-AT polyketide synthase, acyltransferase and oxidoreductase domains
MYALRDEIQRKYSYDRNIRIGAAGGISTPISALGAFMMGAAYIVTGSINQSCVEASASEYTRNLLGQAGMADVIMAPAADMFEMGVRVQVLRRGTMFAMRAQKLYEIYKNHSSIDEIPTEERQKIEKTIFKTSLNDIWDQTLQFFNERDPAQVARAEQDPHHKMALIFRWYLGLSSHWSNHGEKGREIDYQVWCGPSMGAFNDWVRGSYLEDPQNRSVVDLAQHILTGAAYLSRLQQLKMRGIETPAELFSYQPWLH